MGKDSSNIRFNEYGDLVQDPPSTTPPTTPQPTPLSNSVMDPAYTPQLGANLNPDYYGKWMSQLPANMPGGGGSLLGIYKEQTPFTPGANTAAGFNQFGNFANYYGQPANLYNPYLGTSSIPPIGTGPFSYGTGMTGMSNPYYNPYPSTAPNMSYKDQYDAIRATNQYRDPQHNLVRPADPWVDTSPNTLATGGPIHGNTEGWVRSDQDVAAQTMSPYQIGAGTQTNTGTGLFNTPVTSPTPGGNQQRNRYQDRYRGTDRYGSRPDWANNLINQDYGYGGGIDPATGRYVTPSQQQMDASMARIVYDRNNMVNQFMDPMALARMRTTLARRYS